MSFPFLIEHICKFSSRLTEGKSFKVLLTMVLSVDMHAVHLSAVLVFKFDEHPGQVMRMGFIFAIILYSEELITDKLHN